jgi:methionyl-tRNA formyltransferase
VTSVSGANADVDAAAEPARLPSTAPTRLVYFGTPAMAVAPLEALVAAGFDIVCVVTRIDKRRGRGSELQPSAVKLAAQQLGVPVVHTVDEALSIAARSGAELGVVVAFGQLIKPHALAALPMVNLHFSLLPRWRGAAPVERALLEGDDVTGVCLMQLEAGFDTGPLLDVVEVPITPSATGATLRSELVDVGTEILVRRLREGFETPMPQHGAPSYAAKIGPGDLRLDWNSPARVRDRQIRLGGAWTTFRGKRLKVHAAELIDPDRIGAVFDDVSSGSVGGLRLISVQPEGKASMSYRDFANGARPVDGDGFE